MLLLDTAIYTNIQAKYQAIIKFVKTNNLTGNIKINTKQYNTAAATNPNIFMLIPYV